MGSRHASRMHDDAFWLSIRFMPPPMRGVGVEVRELLLIPFIHASCAHPYLAKHPPIWVLNKSFFNHP